MLRIFISSTFRDLETCRHDLTRVLNALNFSPYFAIDYLEPQPAITDELLGAVSECSLMIAVVDSGAEYGVGHHHGVGKSGQWSACERAASEGKDILAFIRRFSDEATAESSVPQPFKVWLDHHSVCRTMFDDIDDFLVLLRHDLEKWTSVNGERMFHLPANPATTLDMIAAALDDRPLGRVSDEEFLSEYRVRGQDPEVLASRVREWMLVSRKDRNPVAPRPESAPEPERKTVSPFQGARAAEDSDSTALSDEDLMERFRDRNDAQAFDELYRKFSARLYGYHLALSQNQASVAEDLTQETFCRVIDKRNSFNRETGNFVVWLFRLAAKTRIDIVRRSRQAATAVLDALINDVAAEPMALQNLVAGCLDNLSELDRKILLLTVVEGFTLAEVARILDMPPARIAQRRVTALKRLRSLIGPNPALAPRPAE